jgi:ribosome recycling factor
MINEIIDDAKSRMEKSIVSLRQELTKLRTGRAHPGLLDHIKLDYYGTDTPLSQVASVSVEGPRSLLVTPWEKNMIAAIEKAILKSDLGLNPSTAGTVIRIPLPALTEERRRDLVKVVRDEAEKARIAVRNIRREAISSFKDLEKEKEISEDDERRAQTVTQKLTDEFVEKIESVVQEKEADLMAV